MYNSDHTATECKGQNFFFLLSPQSVDVLSRFIYTALWMISKPMIGVNITFLVLCSCDVMHVFETMTLKFSDWN